MATRKLLISPCIMSVHYRGCAVQRGMFSTSGGYHENNGDIMSTLGGVQYIGGISRVHRGNIMINVGEGHWENNCICMETPVY